MKVSKDDSYLLFQRISQSGKFLFQQQVLKVALLLYFMDGLDKLAVQFIAFVLSLKTAKERQYQPDH